MSTGSEIWRTSVRDLVEFCCRCGDIDYRFTPSPTAVQGIEGHQYLYRQRPDTYQREYPVVEEFEANGIRLEVRGRADGYDASATLVEEIKTCRVSPSDIPQATLDLHRAQASIYAALICRSTDLDEITVRLTYLNIDSGLESSDENPCSRRELDAYMLQIVDQYSEWLVQRSRHRLARNSSAHQLRFCHENFRAGQRELAELTYKCQATGGQLLAEAPTGIGKTAATLYPSLKGLATGLHEQLLYLTAKTQGRMVAEDTLREFVGDGMVLNSLSLSARDKVCFSPGQRCQGDECLYARGFFDRLPAARSDALSIEVLDRAAVEVVARHHEVCPYQLAAELVPWVDVVVGDYYYVYGWHGFLRGGEDDSLQRSVLVDEAHNLPSRARAMYSATLRKKDLMAARKQTQGAVKRALAALNRGFLELGRQDWDFPDHSVLTELPSKFSDALARVSGAVAEAAGEDGAYLSMRPAVMEFFFACLHFQRVGESIADDYQILMRRREGRHDYVIELNCLDPARLLAERHDCSRSTTCFSATVSPLGWMAAELGLGESCVGASLDSPFEPTQLSVTVDDTIDTRYRARESSLEMLRRKLVRWVSVDERNTVVYFPSYQYMTRFLDFCGEDFSARTVWVQRREQDEQERQALIDLLRAEDGVLGFCILGGVFSEGIDLPGRSLSRVAVVGVGTPQLNADNQALREYYERTGRPGFDFTYLYPGMQKVCQALGRVIRSEADTGEVLLLDSRYRQKQYRDLLPEHWHTRMTGDGQPQEG